jgi:hypothetical protein
MQKLSAVIATSSLRYDLRHQALAVDSNLIVPIRAGRRSNSTDHNQSQQQQHRSITAGLVADNIVDPPIATIAEYRDPLQSCINVMRAILSCATLHLAMNGADLLMIDARNATVATDQLQRRIRSGGGGNIMSPNHSILPTHTPLIACQHS